MLKPLRVLHTGLASGRWNTALSAGLLRARASDDSYDVLRLYRFTPCLLLGQTEDIAVAAAARTRSPRTLEVARRVTGGGAVYMSETMLAWDVLTGFSEERDEISERIGKSIATALSRIGWPSAAFVPPNDIMVEGLKVSGAATASRGQAFLHQGTLLLRDEIHAMAQALGLPAKALQDRVTCLEAHGPLPPDDAIQKALIKTLAAEFAREPIASDMSSRERVLVEEEFAAEIGRDGYVFGDVAAEERHP